jgi:acetolactate synthase-1/2/3 large subunit
VDIDPAEIGKIRRRMTDRRRREARSRKNHPGVAQTAGRDEIEKRRGAGGLVGQVKEWQREHPLSLKFRRTRIKPQHLMGEIDRLSGGEGDRLERRRPAPDVGPRS